MKNSCNLCVRWTKGRNNFEDPFSVRKKVFIVEQNIDEDVEFDEYDDVALHLVIYDANKPIATGRLFEKSHIWVIGRVCVLKEYRGLSIGEMLMLRLLEKADGMDAKVIEFDSQVYAICFYRKFGFKEFGGDLFRFRH
jgi:predicted GNAT family N-acyltransferase